MTLSVLDPSYCIPRGRGSEKVELNGEISMAGIQMLPYGDVDSNLRAMAGSAEGFGRHAIGGLHDDGPGSLREGCRRNEPLWIVFEVSGTINLSSYLSVSSYKTIDGRGHKVKLTGKGLRLKECEHIIVCNLEFEGGRGHDVDGIQIKPNSRHIWIDRCTLRDYDDGLIDITRQSTDITVSRCYFGQHDKTMLIGADPTHVGDRCIRVTIHHCFFDGTRQRQPRVRFGKVHLYNNYTRNWGVYAVCASVESQAADKEEQKSGIIVSEGDMLLNGAQPCLLTQNREVAMFHPSEYYPTWTMEAAAHSLREILQLCTGWQSISRPVDRMVSN
ncbi:hypothetical protein LR48_Vigan02g268300 [Vigna angularis]|uniref:Pectate lyase n=1 Tax=Phaseolus angularis TaxID=3914 RepID=A0A0L9U135_PHAAN|nr:hypothetical protein LR48_Vigan02g268300 [Vigna angularis]